MFKGWKACHRYSRKIKRKHSTHTKILEKYTSPLLKADTLCSSCVCLTLLLIDDPQHHIVCSCLLYFAVRKCENLQTKMDLCKWWSPSVPFPITEPVFYPMIISRCVAWCFLHANSQRCISSPTTAQLSNHRQIKQSLHFQCRISQKHNVFKKV